MGGSLSTFPLMPQFEGDWEDRNLNPYIAKQLNYVREDEERYAEQNVPLVNAKQKVAFDFIYTSTSLGGTEKTFVYSTLCRAIHANGWICTMCSII